MNIKHFIPFIGAMVLLIIAIAAYSFEYSLIGTQSAQAAALATSIAQKTQVSQNIALERSQLTALKSQEATINQYFISTTDVVPFLEQLASTGNYFGSTVTVSSVAATPGTPYGQLNISLQIVGPFDSVLRTIGAIEYGPYATTLTSLSLSTPTGTGTAPSQKWTANAFFTIGAQTTPAAVATAAAPAAAPALAASTTAPTPAASASSSTVSAAATSSSPTKKSSSTRPAIAP
jgi:hypothetical protein